MHFSTAPATSIFTQPASAGIVHSTAEVGKEVQPNLCSVLPRPPMLSPLIFAISSLETPSSLPLPTALPCTALPLPLSPLPKKTPANAAVQLETLRKRLYTLEEEKYELETFVESLQTRTRLEQVHLQGIKCNSQASRLDISIIAEKNRFYKMGRETIAYERVNRQREAFAEALVDFRIAELVETGMEIEMLEEVIVEAIRKASEDELSVWASIISAVVGPLAPENYVSAINMSLEARKELRSVRKIARFWKRSAQQQGSPTDVVTPSASTLSQVKEPLSLDRQKAMEQLQSQKKGVSNIDNTRTRMSTALPYLLPSSESRTNLPPLASQTFRGELFAVHPHNSLFSSSSPKHLRLEPQRLGLEITRTISMKVRSSSDCGIYSLTQKQQERPSASVLQPIENGRPYSGIEHTPDNPSVEPAAEASTGLQVSLLQAERALHSFERICNTFSSSNFSSLNATGEQETDVLEAASQDVNDVTLINPSTSTSNTNTSLAVQSGAEIAAGAADKLDERKPGAKEERNILKADEDATVSTPPKTSIPILRSLSRQFSFTSPSNNLSPPHRLSARKVSPRLLSPSPSRGCSAAPDNSPLTSRASPTMRFKPVAPLHIVKKNKSRPLKPFRV
ncbi:hypothetical protein WG66_002945 [Moniliophthora roreri]|nr:hypothetical protein WG66_002945 [Moniliophthora roreri]